MVTAKNDQTKLKEALLHRTDTCDSRPHYNSITRLFNYNEGLDREINNSEANTNTPTDATEFSLPCRMNTIRLCSLQKKYLKLDTVQCAEHMLKRPANIMEFINKNKGMINQLHLDCYGNTHKDISDNIPIHFYDFLKSLVINMK